MLDIQLKKSLHGADGPMAIDVSLTVAAGEFITLFGESGAGKTSILRMLAGLMAPDAGRIQVGEEVWYDNARGIALSPQRRSVGLVFQDYALFPHLTVRENLEFAVAGKGEQAFIAKLLEMTNLVDLAGKKPATLSGGQKQRVALARALARRPRLLLLDEPLSALDLASRLRLQDELQQLHREFGTTTILVSHELSEVFKLSQRVFQLAAGKVIKSGTPEEVFIRDRVSGKFRFTGEVVAIRKEEVIHVITVLVGNHAVNAVASDDDVRELNVGDRVVLFSKAFNPIIMKVS